MPGFGEHWLLERMLIFVPLVLSLSIHEWAHAYSAFKLGDDTAKHLGRLTLNPIEHIDPVGTLALPLLGVPFGWAKPVPVNSARFRSNYSLRTGMLLVAIAGPISNLVLAAISIALLWTMSTFSPTLVAPQSPLHLLLVTMIFLNVILAVFNLIPLPPLDGHYIADALMPKALRPAWEQVLSIGYVGVILIILGPIFLGISLFDYPIKLIQSLIVHIT